MTASAANLVIDGTVAPLSQFSAGCPTSFQCFSFPAQDYNNFTVGAAPFDVLGPRLLIGDTANLDTMILTGFTTLAKSPTAGIQTVVIDYSHTFSIANQSGTQFYGFRMAGNYPLARSGINVVMAGSGIFQDGAVTTSLGQISANISTNPNFSVRRPTVAQDCIVTPICGEFLSQTFTADIFAADTLTLPGSLDTAFGQQVAVDQFLTPIPEPSSLLLLGFGLAGIAGSKLNRLLKQT